MIFSAKRSNESASVSENSDQPVNYRHRQDFAAQSSVNNSQPNTSSAPFIFSAKRSEKSAYVSENRDQPVNDRHKQAFADQRSVNDSEPNTSSAPRHVDIPETTDVLARTPSQASGQGLPLKTRLNQYVYVSLIPV